MRRELEPEKEEDESAARAVNGDEEQAEQNDAAARRARALVRFEQVAASMERILDPKPVLDIEEGVTLADERALEELYAAARGNEDGKRVSGFECMKKLNRALAALRPALAAGLDPTLPEQHRTYEHLADQVGELRDHLTQRIGVEAVIFSGGAEAGAGEDAREEGEEEAPKEAAVVRAKQALALFTDELARSAGRRRKRSALAAVADAAQGVIEAGDEPGAAQARLEAAVAALLADPEAAAAGLEMAGTEAFVDAVARVRGTLGHEPEGSDAIDAAAHILESAAGAGPGDAAS